MTELKALIIDKSENKPFHTSLVPGNFKPMIKALEAGGITAKCVVPQTSQELIRVIREQSPEIVFSAAYGIEDEKGESNNVHRILESLGVPYIGSTSSVLDIVIDKTRLKDIWIKNGVRTPSFLSFNNHSFDIEKTLNQLKQFPYIVKPSKSGNSRGIDQSSVVEDSKKLHQKLSEMIRRYGNVMVEEYLGESADFQEITVARIGNGKTVLMMPAKIQLTVYRALPVISTIDKENPHTRAHQVEDDRLWNKIIDFSHKAFESTGVLDYARLDLIFAGGEIFAIEINGQPMIPDRWFEACANGAGLDPVQYMNAIFLAGIVRWKLSGGTTLKIPPRIKELLPQKVYAILSPGV